MIEIMDTIQMFPLAKMVRGEADPVTGLASKYMFTDQKGKKLLAGIDFQNGDPVEEGINGIQHEDLILVMIDRLESLLEGPLKCDAFAFQLGVMRGALRMLRAGCPSRDEDEKLKMDGYDDCIAGICERFGQNDIVAYDYDKVIAKLMADGMDDTEAQEWFEFNQVGAWMGDGTPCFIREYDEEE